MSRDDDDNRRHMEWATDAGQVVLSYPAELPPADIDDVEALFALTIRILRRRAERATLAQKDTQNG